jgi:sec-independent protein translocase protein TatB
MDILDIGMNELVVIVLLAAVVLGPERLARTARQIGRLVREIKLYFSAFNEELKAELDVLDEIEQVKKDITKI